MPDKPYEDVEIEGHLIDSLMMPQIMDHVMDLDGEFEMLTFQVGRMKDDPSHAVMRIYGRDAAHLEELLTVITEFGVVAVRPQDVVLEAADRDGVFPDAFYATTNLATFVRVRREWVRVEHPEMDCGIRVDPQALSAETVAMSDVKAGELYVTGHRGIRVLPLERPRESQPFEFMASAVSQREAQGRDRARDRREHAPGARGNGKAHLAVLGPAVVHTGGGAAPGPPHPRRATSTSCSPATPWPRTTSSSLYGTSLGVCLEDGPARPEGHEHHLRAINTIRRLAASIGPPSSRACSTAASCTSASSTGTPFVLAGSIRDDGPLPEVITDALEAQRRDARLMRSASASA